MYDLALRLLEYDPAFRATLRQAMRHSYFDRLAATLAFGDEDDAGGEEGEDVVSSAAAAENVVDLLEDGSTAAHILRLQI